MPIDPNTGLITPHGTPDEINRAERDRRRVLGASVGEMQAKMLAKIEELTLHMIEAEKENQELRARVARLEAQSGPQRSDAERTVARGNQ